MYNTTEYTLPGMTMSLPISNLLAKFANSFDRKDWQALSNLLSDSIDCDYSDLRANSGKISRSEYINKRKQALQHLRTQHLFSNIEIYKQDKAANCRANAIIMRVNDDDEFFHSHAMYEFDLIINQSNQWQITSIKQTILWNEGNANIHVGVNPTEK